MIETQQLLRDYVENGSEAAFREIVDRYVNLTHSTAIRLVDNNSQAAEDVVQLVFTDLARKASSLPPNVQLGGWLYRHTCFTAANLMRGERRRLAREKEAVEMSLLENESIWNKVAPVLDAAIKELHEDDQQAITLRFFEQCDLRTIGRVLGVSDDAAQKRVTRAVEKLRDLVARRGATLTVAALGTLLASEAVKAAPIGLAAKTSGAALAGVKAAAALPKVLSAKLALVTAALLMITVVPLVWVKMLRVGKADGLAVATPPLAAVSTNTPSVSKASTNSVSEAMKRANKDFQAALTKSPPLGSNTLRLQIVAADSGRPIPNVPLDELIQTKNYSRQKLFGNRMGICDVKLPPGIKSLQLTTQVEGFADTRLSWNPERGDKIPTNYVVRLTRPIAIGGLVVGPDNEPVEGATIGWNHMDTASMEDKVESHAFQWIETKSGPNGRWHLERIALEMLSGSHATASHSNYVSASMMEMVDGRGSTKGEEELKKETYIFRLGPTITIRGVIVEDDGHPVPNAKILIGPKDTTGTKDVKADADGTFAVKGCRAGKNPLTAEAKGFAATTIEVDAQKDSPPFTLQLKRGRILRLRVVDDVGSPVAKANVILDTFNHGNTNPARERGMPTQARFTKKTDVEGKVVWENAPDEELEFNILSAGHMQLNGYSVRPDGEEHVATLAPALIVRGTVRDGSTAKSIPRFRMICGWPSIQIGGLQPTWSSFDRDWIPFTDGKFYQVFTSPLIYGGENPGYVLKFEAEGYTPFVTRFIKPDEREVELDIVLKPAQTTMITALLPDGRPAAMADVGWIAPNAQLKLIAGGFSKNNNQNTGYLRLTDANGQFRLPTEESVTRVVVACSDGYGEAMVGELSSMETLQLVPWGRLEGTYLSGRKPVTDRELTVDLQGAGISSSIEYDFSSRVKVDEQGRFVFPKLPPGKHKLIYLAHTQISPTSGSFSPQPLQDVDIRSGETTTVTIGDSGYTIKLHFDHPEKLPFGGEEPMTGMVMLHAPIPSDIKDNVEAMEAWAKTPEGEACLKSFHSFYPEKGGSWVAENVTAGTYVAELYRFKMGADKKPQARLHAEAAVTVPETPATGTIDLGQLEIKEMPLPEGYQQGRR